MYDFSVNSAQLISNSKSTLLDKSLQLFIGENLFENKVNIFLKWLSDSYYPYQAVFIAQVAPKMREDFNARRCIYGGETELLNQDDLLIRAIKKIDNLENNIFVGLTNELLNRNLRADFESNKIVSYLILPLRTHQKTTGYLALLENDTERLWSKEDRKELSSLSLIFSQYFYAATLEKELFTKEDVLQKAIESSNDGYWHIDLTQNQMHFSRQWKRMLGFDEDEIEDSFETFENLLHPSDKDVVLQVLDPYMKIGVGTYECEYRIRNKDGKYLWVLTRANVNFSENGIPLQFVATNTDITSRIEYKRKLAQSEANYKRLISSIHEIIFEIDEKGVITFLNGAWERHLLLKVDKTIGTEATKYIHPDDRAIGNKIFTLKYSGEDVLHKTEEVQFIAANGKSVWMEVHASVIFNESHELQGVKGTLINIEERKRVEIQNKASENRLARISENISDLIAEIDENGNYLFISNAVRGMIGKNPDEFIGRNAILDIHPDDHKRIRANIYEQLLNGAKRVVEQYRVKMAEGGYIWIESVLQPLISASGKRTFIAATRDISARRKVEEEMKLALAKEKELNELKSRFITMTSHEFRTPLSSIKSSVELLEMYAEDLGDRFIKPFEKHFTKITTQVSRINNLLKNIDTLGKIESMEMPFNPIKQNLVEFAKCIINEQIKEAFPDRTVELKIIGTPRVLIFDPSLLDNLMCNVLKNGLLYSNDSNVCCELVFEKDSFSVVITDEGIGIPEDEMGHLFTSFFRAKNIVNLNIPGNGLGLVIAKKIIDLHHGEIKIDSEVNVGTKVAVHIPNIKK
jgi:PAS domain S-box-containing protein